jgi:alkylation response protein AidB-like acyl-CoA dehydrogenase
VDLELSDDQELFRVTSRRFINDALPLTAVRAMADDGRDVDHRYLRQAAELGWFTMLVPEEAGGGSISGHGVRDAAIAAEERGRVLQPGAFTDMNVVAAAIAAGGSEEAKTKVLPDLLAGQCVAAWAVSGPTGTFDPAAGVVVSRTGDAARLQGAKVLVQDAHLASWFLVSATDGDGVSQFLVPADAPGVHVRRRSALDLTRRLSEVRFDDVEVDASMLVGLPREARAAVERQLDVACVLGCAESVGAMDVIFDATVQYAKVRTAFGRPIGSFQAVKHLLADTAMTLEQSKAISVAATRAVDAETPDSSALASTAKAFIGEAGVTLAHNCWQAFGGIAFTWDHDFHLFLRRLTLDTSLYGEATFHLERLCRLNHLGEH